MFIPGMFGMSIPGIGGLGAGEPEPPSASSEFRGIKNGASWVLGFAGWFGKWPGSIASPAHPERVIAITANAGSQLFIESAAEHAPCHFPGSPTRNLSCLCGLRCPTLPT